MTNLTSYEVLALTNIVNGCNDNDINTSTAEDYSCCYCEADIRSISKACNITENQAKGVLSSLVKKSLVFQQDEDFGFMINLTHKGYEVFTSL
jgi:hypothetical protein